MKIAVILGLIVATGIGSLVWWRNTQECAGGIVFTSEAECSEAEKHNPNLCGAAFREARHRERGFSPYPDLASCEARFSGCESGRGATGGFVPVIVATCVSRYRVGSKSGYDATAIYLLEGRRVNSTSLFWRR